MIAIVLAIDTVGQVVAQLPDADGELHDYRLALGPREPWACHLTRVDSDEQRNVVEERGRWSCSCPAMLYRKRGAPECKHIQAARALRAALRQMADQQRTAQALQTA